MAASLVSRTELTPIPGSPFLQNTRPARVGKQVMVVCLGAAVVGAIGGGHGLQPWFAGILLVGGVLGFLKGLIFYVAHCGTPQMQYCPACLSPMGYGATVCPQARHHVRLNGAQHAHV